jgi:hypothetical protein
MCLLCESQSSPWIFGKDWPDMSETLSRRHVVVPLVVHSANIKGSIECDALDDPT